MESIIVKIDHSSIKKNPNAGKTVSYVAGRTEISFSCNGIDPALLKNCIITSRDTFGRMEGLISNPKHAAELEHLEGMTITHKYEKQIIHHAPLPKWLFEYEKPMVECNNCKVSMPVNQIILESSDNGEGLYDICPICNAFNSFPSRTYEDINDVVNLLKLN